MGRTDKEAFSFNFNTGHSNDRSSQLDAKFSSKMNSLIGIPYKLGGSSRTNIDCSGSVILVLREMGYNVGRENANSMASGDVDWLTSIPVDVAKTGDSGVLNFYDFGGDGVIDHVNVGVGKAGVPLPITNPMNQIVDATEGSTLNQRAGRDGQYYTPKAGQINQTYPLYPTSVKPSSQAQINWDVLESKYPSWHPPMNINE
jgi:cell wall-associated NlpC family hydrolase